uniref:Uncharacterized protein n=1 Tax=Glossina brevipalpis TaxID=37001 RepID=A0A1A9W078_9MUSC
MQQANCKEGGNRARGRCVIQRFNNVINYTLWIVQRKLNLILVSRVYVCYLIYTAMCIYLQHKQFENFQNKTRKYLLYRRDTTFQLSVCDFAMCGRGLSCGKIGLSRMIFNTFALVATDKRRLDIYENK